MRRREDGGVVVDKKYKKSTNFQQKNSSDLLTGYSNNAHRNSGSIFLIKKNLNTSGALRQQGLLII